MTDTQKEAGDLSLVQRQPLKLQRSWTLTPGSLGEAMEIANIIAGSDFAPKDYKGKPQNVMIAIQMGADVGLKPMQALQNIAIINGRPSIYGDAALALSMDVLERFHETFEGKEGEDAFTAVCVSQRKGWPDETRTTFSIADAKKANLWGKAGPWQQYPKRMLQWRARGFNLRNVASDRLLGLILAEEAQDLPAIEGTVIASEVVQPVVSLLDRVPEALRDNLEKAFEVLNLAPGLRLVKINEFLAGDGVDPEAAAQQLLDWCRDEFAKRKTGQARKKKDDGNGKAKPATPVPAEPAATADTSAPQDPPVVQGPPAKPVPAPPAPEVTAAADEWFV